jgi:hypothetical protein
MIPLTNTTGLKGDGKAERRQPRGIGLFPEIFLGYQLPPKVYKTGRLSECSGRVFPG